MHSGEKSHKCKQCGFAFTGADRQLLLKYLKTHNGERSNKCNQCEYASSYAGDFRRHLKTHTGEKSQGMVEVGKMTADGQADFEVPY